jgi:hypothetical protein
MSPYVPLAGSGTTQADASITSNNVLTVTARGDGWENGASGGFFLYRYVPGDFQMAVQVQAYSVSNYNQPGLLARGYTVSTNGDLGAPLGLIVPNGNGTNDQGEYWVSFTRFDEFNIGTYARRNVDSGVSQNTQNDQVNPPGGVTNSVGTNFWLLIVRNSSTEFDFYKRFGVNDTWVQVPNKTHYSLSQFAGRPMQVGIMGGPWSNPGDAYRTTQFDNFMLDQTTGSGLQITVSGGNAIVSWPPIPGTLQSTTSLAPQNWQNEPGTPVLGPSGYSITVPLDAAPKFFRLVQ